MVAGRFVVATVLLGVQWYQADAIAAEGWPRRVARIALIAVLVPFLIVSLYRDWIGASEAVRLGATFLWLGGTVLIRLAMAAANEWSASNRSVGAPSNGPIPNVLREVTQPNTLYQPRSDITGQFVAQEQPRGGRLAGVLGVLLLAGVVVAPMTVEAVATQTPCETVEVLLATRDREDLDLAPIQWMPEVATPPYELTLDRQITLEILVASRRNPEESRIELVRDGFVDGHERSYVSSRDHIEYGAQRFQTAEGALDFHAFANRYACQFANETFRGLRGSIGLQIRFASGKPIGEQVSWVSGTTRLLVLVDFDEPPTDHFRVEVLTRSVRVE
jgi:hypothetical protein